MLDPRPKPAPSVTVLLVDGTPRDMRTVGELLREQGHDVVSAGSGVEALGSLESLRPDVIRPKGFQASQGLHPAACG
ncbi:MAG: response regulator, partial [Verrucomicrobiaceae bacterium]